MSDDILTARALLMRLAEPANIPLWDEVRTYGPVEALRRIHSGHADQLQSPALKAKLRSADPQLDLEVAQRHGIRLAVPEHDDWPHFAFAALERTGAARVARYRKGDRSHSESGELIPPLALWVRGRSDLSTLAIRSVAVVGARAATAYGEYVANKLAYGLASRGFTVVSGGAYGIDAVAHRAALTAGGETVIVSAGGLERPYPSSNATLFERAMAHGLLLSESPPGVAPARRRFLTRNRLIAALSTGTVVVEASGRSGASNTAKHCWGLERPLMAVPGPITSAMSVGCHTILANASRPSTLVTSVDDVLGVIGSSSDLPAIPLRAADGATVDHRRAVLDSLDHHARRVFDAFPARRSADVEEIALVSGLSPLEVVRSLPALELSALVEATADGFRIVKNDAAEPSSGGPWSR